MSFLLWNSTHHLPRQGQRILLYDATDVVKAEFHDWYGRMLDALINRVELSRCEIHREIFWIASSLHFFKIFIISSFFIILFPLHFHYIFFAFHFSNEISFPMRFLFHLNGLNKLLYGNGHGNPVKSTGPPRPASASSKLIITAMAASSFPSVLTGWLGDSGMAEFAINPITSDSEPDMDGK